MGEEGSKTSIGQREFWDQEATRYASGVGESRYGRFLALYEESCWPYIEATLPAGREDGNQRWRRERKTWVGVIHPGCLAEARNQTPFLGFGSSLA
jgi:hypothetical protein